METASSGLSSATNELSVASLRAKSASGDLQSTVLAMSDCACEASVALSAYACVSNRHSALTSECGSMLEEVLAITEDLHDVHSLGKEAAAVHCSLVQELSKANAILLPLETVLSKDVAAMTDAMARGRETKTEISPIHGQAIYQSYSLRIREARQAIEPLVPSLTSSVKGLYSMLTRLARTASLHAGNLHKALEGLGESQEVESPVIDVSRPDLAADATGFDEKEEKESLSMSNGESTKDFLGITGLPLEAKGWLSPPDSICSSSTESGITLAEESFPGSFNDPEDIGQQLFLGPSSREATDYQNTAPYSQNDNQEITDSAQFESKYTEVDNIHVGSFKSALSDPNEYPQAVASPSDESATVGPEILRPSNENTQEKFGSKEEISSLNKVKIKDENRDAMQASSRVGRGKNPYAMLVLRRVEMKLDGRDIAENREISISEQVDYLLKQATSVDNLCNISLAWCITYLCSILSISQTSLWKTNMISISQVAFQKEQDLHLCRNTKTTTQPEMRFWTVPSSFIVGNFESSLSFTFFFSSSRYLLYWGRMVEDIQVMSAVASMWSSEMNKRTRKDQTLASNASGSTDPGSSQEVQAKGGINSTVLAPIFGRVVGANSLLTSYSEASISMLVDWFSA
ncbi:serine/threonine-protein kinase SMG1 [Prunus yedoensis var. nudiflora]|uniref:Serine/threonine-protein kinase SMG1 n=1 Tax=Prunus yedoensis var. nudiflora TaxID=2094558 RepID=A0A314ZY27_PRUYE|nr:serine/threonine-protein kinase SMG1 [Prunus yedoensis var. nudiflora]